jgi:quinoprotein glucose dehydrogenase
MLLFLAIGALIYFSSPRQDVEWVSYDGNNARSHYSTLDQVNIHNASCLKIAWSYSSGGADSLHNRTQIECNPIEVHGILYGVSANTQAFAIDAATGEELWKTQVKDNGGTTSRGVTYWEKDGDERIFFGAGKWLYAFNAVDGQPIKDFGVNGRIDLEQGLRRPGADHYVSANTPNTVYKDLIITGVRVSESETALLGDIRAYNAKTGTLVWTFHTIPAPGEPGFDTWSPPNPRQHLGGANSWMGMALDIKRGILYAPTGSAAFDFYGGNRKGNNLYANCLLALDAASGKLLWYQQLVHHDIWDRDPPAPPNLLTVHQGGKEIPAVAQVTKQGYVFAFNRLTGQPLFPIDEKAFPQDGIQGEAVSPTQPVPRLPLPFTRQSFTEHDFSAFVANRDSLVQLLRQARTGGPFIPVTDKMTIFYPGTGGGAQWGGAGTDPQGTIYIPAKEIPVYTRLVYKETPALKKVTGETLFDMHCAACHGKDRRGSPDGSYPSLINISSRITIKDISQLLKTGRGMMPSFSHLSEAERGAIIRYVYDNTRVTVATDTVRSDVPYRHTGYNRWYDQSGYPVNTPPWGTLTAIDLNSGKRRWQIPLGVYASLIKKGVPPTGTPNFGGPVVTAGGLVIMAGTPDELIRIFDKNTGKLLWKHALPTGGYATPCTYSVKGKQYIVIACGGGKLGSRAGDRYVAFSL